MPSVQVSPSMLITTIGLMNLTARQVVKSTPTADIYSSVFAGIQVPCSYKVKHDDKDKDGFLQEIFNERYGVAPICRTNLIKIYLIIVSSLNI